MLVHRVRAGKQLDKVVETDGQNNGQPDGRPQRVTTADPVPELEHIGRVDTKFADRFGVGGERSKVFRHVFFIACSFQEPVARAVGVGHGFWVVKVFDATRTESFLGSLSSALQRCGYHQR